MSKPITVRRWSVLDTRCEPKAEVYDLAVLENNEHQYSFVRIIMDQNGKETLVITVVAFGKLPNDKLIQFAEGHVEFLERNYCFCRGEALV